MNALRRLALAALLAFCTCARAAGPGGEAFSFGVLGDMPYFAHERAWVEDIVVEMSVQPLAFAIHVGDIKGGSTPCTDAEYEWNRVLFERSRHPLVYLPGDNDWTDCHRAGGDPFERLARLRAIFYPTDESLGQQRIALERQSADPRFAVHRENVRWVHGGVLFVTLNVTGSGNRAGRSEGASAEYRARNAANLDWLARSFALARERALRAVVVAIHANPRFDLRTSDARRAGYNEFLARLEAETIAFARPVLLLHGDTHHYRVDKPMTDTRTRTPVPNFTRAETFGTPVLGWMKVTYDPSAPEAFRVEPMLHRARAQGSGR